MMLLNCVDPHTDEVRRIAAEMQESYHTTVLPVSCIDLEEGGYPGDPHGIAVCVPHQGGQFRHAGVDLHA